LGVWKQGTGLSVRPLSAEFFGQTVDRWVLSEASRIHPTGARRVSLIIGGPVRPAKGKRPRGCVTLPPCGCRIPCADAPDWAQG
jgi:hypothetical protein